VWVPIFRPAQLPRTAPLAVTTPNTPAPVQEEYIRNQLGTFALAMPPTQINVATLQPDPSIQNSQVGLRVAGRLAGLDLSVSYYHGRWGIPTPAWATNQANGVISVGVMWPRMDVLGADIAGSIAKLGGIGYWIEAGVFFPQLVNYGLYDDNPVTSLTGHDSVSFIRGTNGGPAQQLKNQTGHYLPIVIPSTPFLKLTAGIDYSWNKYLYTNLQYVYGFIDEFGAGKASYIRPGEGVGGLTRTEARIGHYLVAGADLKLFHDALLFRFFGAFKVPQIGDQSPSFTAVLFPQIAWAVWDATELSLGAFVFLGESDTKFGDPAAGASEIFMKAKFTY
jgi:hypothetical protein